MQPNAACNVLHTQTSKRASRLRSGKKHVKTKAKQAGEMEKARHLIHTFRTFF